MSRMPCHLIGEPDSQSELLLFRWNPRGFREARKDETVGRVAVTPGAVRQIAALCLLI
jgi:hypothetical protein